jgi:WD40 repeat protein
MKRKHSFTNVATSPSTIDKCPKFHATISFAFTNAIDALNSQHTIVALYKFLQTNISKYEKWKGLCTCSFNTIINIVDTKSGETLVSQIDHKGMVTCTVQINSFQILSGGLYDKLRIWDIHSGKSICTFEGKKAGITDIAVHQNTVASASGDHLRLYNIKTGSLNAEIDTVHCESLFFLRDGRLATSDTMIRDAETGQVINTINKSRLPTHIIEVRPGVIGTCETRGKVLLLWDIATGQLVSNIISPSSILCMVNLSNNMFATGCVDGLIIIWDDKGIKLYEKPATLPPVTNKQYRYEMHRGLNEHLITFIGESEPGRIIYQSGKKVCKWDLSTGKHTLLCSVAGKVLCLIR